MFELLKYFVESTRISSHSLKKKGALVDKPWGYIDEGGELQKLIFKRDNKIVLSRNGIASEGSWEYFPEAKSILIDRGNGKILLNEEYIDDSVLILKMDGTDNQYFSLANGNHISDYNVLRYLNNLKQIEFRIQEIPLLSGTYLQLHNSESIEQNENYIDTSILKLFVGKRVDVIDNKYNELSVEDGRYITNSKEVSFYIENGEVVSVKKNILFNADRYDNYEIEGGYAEIKKNVGNIITRDGELIDDSKIVGEDYIFELEKSIITRIIFIKDFSLNDGTSIKLEMRDAFKVNKGDRIIDPNLADGKYNINGVLRKVLVIDNIIVGRSFF